MPGNSTSATLDAASFRRELMRWYRREGRHELPWRATREAYAVLVSEVMLQQTQVERVLPYYKRWLARWPSFEALAAASPAEVIIEWAGLGYNRRALALRRTALTVTHEHGGTLPRDDRALRKLPGIGPYTASAMLSFAFEEPVPVIDTNIGRVIARAALGEASLWATARGNVSTTAQALLPRRQVREHNLALMDLGATTCAARMPACERCPVARMCAWRLAGRPFEAPPREPGQRFEATARYARGRIIDALRARAEMGTGEIEMMLPEEHRQKTVHYLLALRGDGLVEQLPSGAWRLPRPATAG